MRHLLTLFAMQASRRWNAWATTRSLFVLLLTIVCCHLRNVVGIIWVGVHSTLLLVASISQSKLKEIDQERKSTLTSCSQGGRTLGQLLFIRSTQNPGVENPVSCYAELVIEAVRYNETVLRDVYLQLRPTYKPTYNCSVIYALILIWRPFKSSICLIKPFSIRVRSRRRHKTSRTNAMP